jgi:transcriptional regulator with XRE-family HTH domain
MSLLGHTCISGQPLSFQVVGKLDPEQFVTKFAAAVRDERLKQGLSQKKLAEIARVGRTGVVMLEQGTRVPTLFLAKSLANALGCELAALVERAETGAES